MCFSFAAIYNIYRKNIRFNHAAIGNVSLVRGHKYRIRTGHQQITRIIYRRRCVEPVSDRILDINGPTGKITYIVQCDRSCIGNDRIHRASNQSLNRYPATTFGQENISIICERRINFGRLCRSIINNTYAPIERAASGNNT